jgi:uncharacterized protein (DUF1015 family)
MTATTDGRTHTTTGVLGALGLEAPGDGDILPHEETTAKDKADRLNLLRRCRANLSPIWGLSLADGLSAACEPDRPADAVATDDDGVRHELWIVDDADGQARIAAAVAGAPVVIADGHHRFETALAYQAGEADGAPAGSPGSDAILALIVELTEDQLDVRPIHRIVSNVPAGTDVAAALAPWFTVGVSVDIDDDLAHRLVDAGALALVTPDGTRLLHPCDDQFPPETFPNGVELDSRRTTVALRAALPDADVRFHHDIATVAGAVARGEAAAGLLLRPATVAQIKAVAHARGRMPPKTTFFWPKPRTGMVFRPLGPPA